jgi:transposase
MSPVLKNIGLEGYRLVRIEDKPSVQVFVIPKRAPSRCPCCGGGRLRSKGNYERRVRHLPCFGRRASLVVRCRRFRCVQCGRTFVPELPGIRPWRHSSEPFRESLFARHDAGICASALAHSDKVGAATIERIYAHFTQRKARERLGRPCPLVLGIDEHSLHRGQRMVSTFCDLKNRRIFDIVPGRSQAQLEGFLAALKGREKVRVVCIDLSSPYRRLVQRYFPQARVLADRFHVVRLIYEHFLALARAIAPQLKAHRGFLRCLRKRPETLTTSQQQRLEQLLARHPALRPLYEKMHQLRTLMNYKHQTKAACRVLARRLLAGIRDLRRSGLAPLQTLARTLQQWAQPIACMWRFTRNNAITEGFHRKMKLIQRRAYGFRNFHNYRLRVIAQCG